MIRLTLILFVAVLTGCVQMTFADAGDQDAGARDAGERDAGSDADAGSSDGGRVTIVTSDDGKLTLEVGEAAGVNPSILTARRRSAAELAGRDDVVLAYELGPDGARFAAPVTVRFQGSWRELGFALSDGGLELEGPFVVPGLLQTDGGREPLTTPSLALNLSDGGASFSGTLTHFTDLELVQPDHERLIGRLGLSFLGIAPPPEAPVMHVVGLRMWFPRYESLPLGLGLTSMTGTQTVSPPLSFASRAGNPIALLANEHVNVQGQPELSMHGSPITGPPGAGGSTEFRALLKLTPEVHFGFVSVPELSFKATLDLQLGHQAGCTATRTGPGAAQAGRSIGLGLLHGVPMERTCLRSIFGLTPGPIIHSTGLRSEASTNPSTFTLATSIQDAPFTIFTGTLSALYYFSVLSCGPNDWGLTVCPTPATRPPEGAFVVLSTVMGGAVPLADATNRYVYAFVFDSDGVSANNYRAPPNYPSDFYDDTDRWYEASWTPGGSWVLTAKTARGGTIMQVPTAARMVLSGDTLFFIAPRGEFDVATPKWRFTAFRHKGDHGLNPPYDWNGDVEPPVGRPLFEFP